MSGLVQSSVPKEKVPLPLVLILLMYSGTILSPYYLLPFLRPLAPQTLLAAAAMVTGAIYLVIVRKRLSLERIQWAYLAYCLTATIGLYRSHAVLLLDEGTLVVSNIWKHLVLLIIIAMCATSMRSIAITWRWVLVTIALFLLHSLKALLAGHSGPQGRFDNYIGMISNADYIGVFAAISSVLFVQSAQEAADRRLKGLCYALSVISLVIMVKTHTRSALLVLLATVIYWAIWGGASAGRWRRLKLIALVAGLVLVVGKVSSSEEGGYLDRMASILRFRSPEADFNTRSRLFLWQQGLRIGLDHPLLGVGSGATPPYLDLTYDEVDLRERAGFSEVNSLHNSYIQIFSERGSVGILFFLLMVMFSYVNLRYVSARDPSLPGLRRAKVIADGAAIYLVGYAVGAWFITIDYDWTLFVIVGLAVSLRRHVEEQSREAASA